MDTVNWPVSCKRQYLWRYLRRCCPRPPAWRVRRRSCGTNGCLAGGGAISLEADGNGTLTIQSVGGNHFCQWGRCRKHHKWGRWRIGRFDSSRFKNQLPITAVLRPSGGTPPNTTSTYDGGIGGGGRVSFAYSSNLTEGNVDVGLVHSKVPLVITHHPPQVLP